MKKLKNITKFNLRTITTILMLALIISSCNVGSNTVNQSNFDKSLITKKTLKSSSQGLPYTMGGTYDTTTGYPTTATSCLNAGVNGNFIIANPKANLNFEEAQSLSEVLNALGIDIAVTIGWGPFAVTDTYTYAHSSQDDAYTLNFNYIYKYSGTAIFPSSTNMQGVSALTPSAKAVLGLPKQFRQMCGDRYIAQMDAGASVLMNIKLHFNSEVDKNYFDSNLQQLHGLNNVIDIIQANPAKVNYTLTASGIQVGGTPQLLNNIFESAGGTVNPTTGYASVDCSANQGSSQCVSLINKVIRYSLTIGNQLNSNSDYYFSNPIPAKWSTIGIKTGDVNPSQQDLAALQNITNLYQQDQKSFEFINNYSIMLNNYNFLSPNINQNLMNLYSLYQQLMDIYTAPSLNIMDCYGGFISDKCVSINNSLISQRNQIISQNQQLFNFLQYLENNQYEARLLIGNTADDYAYCGLYPITSANSSLFLVDCNGQTTGNINTSIGTQIINDGGNSITVNNLNYSYVSNGQTNNFSYSFTNPFLPSQGYTNNFYNFAGISMNGASILTNHKVSLYQVPFN